MAEILTLHNKLSSDRQVVKVADESSGLLLKGKDVIVENDLIVQGEITADYITANAYSGMILGYTRIQNDSTSSFQANISVNSGSQTVIQTAQGTDVSITFKAPPSGNVEVQFSFWLQATSDGIKFSLSSDSSYAEVDETHTYDADQTIYLDETDHNYNTISFAVTGLTSGQTYTYYLSGLASGAGVIIMHGRNRTGGTHWPPIIGRAIALPTTITTGE